MTGIMIHANRCEWYGQNGAAEGITNKRWEESEHET